MTALVKWDHCWQALPSTHDQTSQLISKKSFHYSDTAKRFVSLPLYLKALSDSSLFCIWTEKILLLLGSKSGHVNSLGSTELSAEVRVIFKLKEVDKRK